MKIYIASDHAGFELKNYLIELVKVLGHEVEDKGAFSYDPNDDYPDFVVQVAREISENPDSTKVRGIVLGGSGQGEAICANRFKHVRAVEYYAPSRGEVSIIKDSRGHNDSNILSLGARFLTREEAEDAVHLWLETPFSGDERHIRRINKIDQ
ncbi:MAG: RpiB/LacA/LacB family sugar-phosphate isomerase [Parcubacteria group bacterium]|nr:RpiB/LacA/LacB family sugar-phosphate isomerase [Parcubacteria group bacterium]